MRAFKQFCQPRSSFFQKQQQIQTMKPTSQYIFTSKSQDIRKYQDQNYKRWNQRYPNIQNHHRMPPLVNGKKISFKDIPIDDNTIQYFPNTSSNFKNQIYKIPPRNEIINNQQIGNNGFHWDNYIQNRQYRAPFKQYQTEPQFFLNKNHRNNDENSRAQLIKTNNIHRQALNQTIIQERNYLAQENRKLKTIIQTQYKPLKQLYQKLIKQQEDRDYLITKLEWKVKQLVKQMKPAQQNSIYNSNQMKQVQPNPAYNSNQMKFLQQNRAYISKNPVYNSSIQGVYRKEQPTDLKYNMFANNQKFIQNQRYIQQPSFKQLDRGLGYDSQPLMNANFRYNNLNQISIIKTKLP